SDLSTPALHPDDARRSEVMGASSLRHADSPQPTSAPGAAIRLAGITHRYGDRVALNDVSFDVRPAEIFGLLGPNGSGKTSLFRILSTLMMPSGGAADIMGANVTAAPNTVRRNIGVVFQAQSVDVKLSAAENLR